VRINLPDLGRPLALGLVLLPLVFTLPATLKKNNLFQHYLVKDYADNLLQSLPPESVFITVSDASYFPLAYGAFVERQRDDVLIYYGDSGEISTQVSPIWKGVNIFPDLSRQGHFSSIDIESFKNRPVYSFEPAFLPEYFRDHFTASPFINSYRAYPVEQGSIMGDDDEDFIRAFDLMVYERSLNERSDDAYSSELMMSMFIPVSHYAYLMRKEGDVKLSSHYYGKALELITPKGLALYVSYLKKAQRWDEMNAFLEAIEPKAKTDPGVRDLSDSIREQFM
jgi:hypothetical protein